MIHATCEDYRAGATYDFQLDEADRAAGARIRCLVLALWGSKGLVGRTYDVLEDLARLGERRARAAD